MRALSYLALACMLRTQARGTADCDPACSFWLDVSRRRAPDSRTRGPSVVRHDPWARRIRTQQPQATCPSRPVCHAHGGNKPVGRFRAAGCCIAGPHRAAGSRPGRGEHFSHATTDQSIPKRPIICIARFDARKGHGVLLNALSLLDRIRNQARVELIGDGPCREEIESDLLRRGLSDTVVIRGWISEAGIKDALDRSRFLVLPSLSEGLPVAIMEAFARARPVIATDVAGIPELVSHRRNGILVAPDDPESLALGLKELLAMTPEELFRLG